MPRRRRSRPFVARQLVAGLLALGLALSGCDATREEAPSFVEGTYTLPDGSTGLFRSEAYAQASPYSGLGTSDSFELKTVPRYLDPSDGVTVGLSLIQDGLAPTLGAFASGLNPPEGRSGIRTYFGLHNVSGVAVEGVLPEYTSTLGVYWPDGTVDLRLEGDRLLGSFELEGEAFTTGDTLYRASVVGRFDVAYEPYAAR